MNDITTMRQMLAGLKQKKVNLEANEKIFLKASGINEEIEKASQDRSVLETELSDAKERRDKAKGKKSTALANVVTKIERKMNKVLPYGRSVFAYSQDENDKFNMSIGWNDGNKTTPYNGLSGAEKQIFDAALANVLEADIIVVEAAELDSDNLKQTILQLSTSDKQIIINTWFPISFALPATFKTVKV